MRTTFKEYKRSLTIAPGYDPGFVTVEAHDEDTDSSTTFTLRTEVVLHILQAVEAFNQKR